MSKRLQRQKDLAEKFREFLDKDSVIDQPTSLAAYECDGLSAYRQLPLLVLLPENREQVQQILRVCSQHRNRIWLVRRATSAVPARIVA